MKAVPPGPVAARVKRSLITARARSWEHGKEFSVVFTARPTGGELRPSDESAEPQWVRPAGIQRLPMHPSMRQRINPAEITGAIKRVEPGVYKLSCIPDVVEPCSRNEVFWQGQPGGYRACAVSDRLDMPPPARKWNGQLGPGQRFRFLGRGHATDLISRLVP
jgi:hypothetical protein